METLMLAPHTRPTASRNADSRAPRRLLRKRDCYEIHPLAAAPRATLEATGW